jgi:hypothetical protein
MKIFSLLLKLFAPIMPREFGSFLRMEFFIPLYHLIEFNRTMRQHTTAVFRAKGRKKRQLSRGHG